jgi:hypothetical protein
MLQFNPYFRPTAKELLKHKVFDSIRTDVEISAPNKILIDIDMNELTQTYGDEGTRVQNNSNMLD